MTVYDINLQESWKEAYLKHFQIASSELVLTSPYLNLYKQTRIHNSFIHTVDLKPVGYGANDFTLLGGNNHPEETATEYIQQLKHHAAEWDTITLSEVPETDPVIPFLLKRLEEEHYIVQIDRSRSFLSIDLTQSYDAYYKDYVHKRTLDLRTRTNKLKREKGNYTIHIEKSNLLFYWGLMMQQYQTRRELTGQPNAFDDPRLAGMIQEIIPEYEAQGWAQVSILRGNDQRDWAYQFDFIKDGIQYHYAPSFDMQYAAYSPSKILLFESIQAGFQNPALHEFNFMRGESSYKKQFAFQQTPYINLVITNPKSLRLKRFRAYNLLTYPKLWLNKLVKRST